MGFDVFISHSHADKAVADAACAALEQAGIRCWIAPRDIAPGDDWGGAIVKAIDQCRAMVLIFSAKANGSRQIRREVERAVHAGATIIPVRIEDVAPTDAMAYFMGTVHWLDAMTMPLDEHLQRLTASIEALLKVRTPDASPSGNHNAQSMPASAPAPASPAMFAEIMNFAHQRTLRQAIGWYLMYLLIGIVLGFTIGRIASSSAQTVQDAVTMGTAAGQLSAIPYHLMLGVLLLWHRVKNASNVMLVLGSVILSIIFGGLGGLIPLAVLSRRPAVGEARPAATRLGLLAAR